MAAQTKADLQREIDYLTAEVEAVKARNGSLVDRLDKLDTEALALAKVVEALKPFDTTDSSYSYNRSPKREAIGRVLNAAAARFGISPDWEAIASLNAQVRMTDSERVELERLRSFVADIQSQSWNARV